MAELDFSIFSFAKLEEDKLLDLLKDQGVETSNCFIHKEKRTTRQVTEEVTAKAARSKFRILILDDELTSEDNLVKELLDIDTSNRDNTQLIIVDNASREDQNEESYKTKYISSYNDLDFKELKFNQSKDSEDQAYDTNPDMVNTSVESTPSIKEDQPISGREPIHKPDKAKEQIHKPDKAKEQIHKPDKAKKPTPKPDKAKSKAQKKAGSDVKERLRNTATVIIAILSIILVYSYFDEPTTVVSNEISIVDQFTSRIKELKSEMVDQDEKLWRVLRSMKHHINDSNPRQPAVLMLVSTKKALEIRENLAREIAEAYSARCSNADYVMVNGAEYTNMNDDDAKLEVDLKILEKFSTGTCATVISNFEKLPPASTKIFYQFCENDNAQYKDVIVIFTLEIEDGPWDVDDYILAGEESTPNSKNWNEIVDQYLHYSLKTRDKTGTMNVDMISPLLSRITPAVAWVGSK